MDLKNSICFWQEVPAALQADGYCFNRRETTQHLLATQVYNHAYWVEQEQGQQHTKELRHPVWLQD